MAAAAVAALKSPKTNRPAFSVRLTAKLRTLSLGYCFFVVDKTMPGAILKSQSPVWRIASGLIGTRKVCEIFVKEFMSRLFRGANSGHQTTRHIIDSQSRNRSENPIPRKESLPPCLTHKLTARIMSTPGQQHVYVHAYVREARAAAAAAAAALKCLKTNNPAFSVSLTAKLRKRASESCLPFHWYARQQPPGQFFKPAITGQENCFGSSSYR